MRLGVDLGTASEIAAAQMDLRKAVALHGDNPPAVACDAFIGIAVAIAAIQGVSGHDLTEAQAELKKALTADPTSPMPV